MCVHLGIKAQSQTLANLFDATNEAAGFESAEKFSGYDHPKLPLFVAGKGGKKTLGLARWGLIPHWAKDRETALSIQNQTLNARAETLHQKPAFKSAFFGETGFRGVLAASHFFEWQHQKSEKVPFKLHPTQEAFFYFPVVLDLWKSPKQSKSVASFSLVTCQANELMARIHNSKKRMPVLLSKSQVDQWLDPKTSPTQAKDLLQASPSDWLKETCLDESKLAPPSLF